MKKMTFLLTLAASGLIGLSCQSGGAASNHDSTALQAAPVAPAASAPIKYLKKYTRILTDDEPEVLTFRYDAHHRMTAVIKQGDEQGGQQLEYDGNSRLTKLTYWHDGRRHVISYAYTGSGATGTEQLFEEGETEAGSTVSWNFGMQQGKVISIRKTNTEVPSENAYQVYRYEGDNLIYIASMAANGKDTAGVTSMAYGKRSSPFAGMRQPLLHPTALFFLQSVNDMTSMAMRSKQVHAEIVTIFEYKYDAQGYPVSGVEKDGGDVSATSVYEYE
ncbi:hypothetical protein [Chitinophaga rhizosphaerae]|uniref:hypothetical protein n=1 Tax=Chitinophaga rhizosphaerae TaxID=1864947 RepID=UPI000F80E327|nr:hypothetical protein [Chitinophaga rhizosphaerae]